MTQPRISVLLPLRNAVATLEECLDSLGDGVQIVAVDHGSTDATPQILAARGIQALRVDGGSLLDALNAGLARCDGAYIARMDGDDRCLPGRFEAQAAILDQHPEVTLCGTHVKLFSEGGLSEGYQAYETWVNGLISPEDIRREIFVECPLPHPTWMGRTGAFEKLGYQDDTLPEDHHFLLRCVEAGFGLAKVPEVLLEWREHPRRHSRLDPRYNRHAFFRLKAKFLGPLFLKGRPACVWGAGERGRLLIRYLQAEGVKVAWAVGLADGGQTQAHGVPVITPDEVPLDLPGPILVCVGSPGVKPVVREWMAGRTLTEGKDWIFVS